MLFHSEYVQHLWDIPTNLYPKLINEVIMIKCVVVDTFITKHHPNYNKFITIVLQNLKELMNDIV